MTPFIAVLGYMTLQRMVELFLSAGNTHRLRALGAYEVGAEHYPFLCLLHGAWLICLALSVPVDTPPKMGWLLVLLGLLLPLRLWIMTSLGERWTTRILVLPGAPLVGRGPYRWVRHPNYMIVAAEIAVLPLTFGADQLALVFSLLNALAVSYRISVEDRALRG